MRRCWRDPVYGAWHHLLRGPLPNQEHVRRTGRELGQQDHSHQLRKNLLIEVDVLGRPYCFLAVADTVVATDPPTYILGDPFLRAAYAVFDWDNQQVRLAQAADCGSNVVAIGIGPRAGPHCSWV